MLFLKSSLLFTCKLAHMDPRNIDDVSTKVVRVSLIKYKHNRRDFWYISR